MWINLVPQIGLILSPYNKLYKLWPLSLRVMTFHENWDKIRTKAFFHFLTSLWWHDVIALVNIFFKQSKISDSKDKHPKYFGMRYPLSQLLIFSSSKSWTKYPEVAKYCRSRFSASFSVTCLIIACICLQLLSLESVQSFW